MAPHRFARTLNLTVLLALWLAAASVVGTIGPSAAAASSARSWVEVCLQRPVNGYCHARAATVPQHRTLYFLAVDLQGFQANDIIATLEHWAPAKRQWVAIAHKQWRVDPSDQYFWWSVRGYARGQYRMDVKISPGLGTPTDTNLSVGSSRFQVR